MFIFCGAIAVLFLALGTSCTDQFIAKGIHHDEFAVGRPLHIDAPETMCNRAEASILALSPRTPESGSEIKIRLDSSKFVAFETAFQVGADRFLGRPFLFSSFSLERHQEIRNVVFRS